MSVEVGVEEKDRASQVARVGFDAAVWEIWPYLAAGASLHLPEEELLSEPEALQDWLVAQGITIAFIPMPMAERLLALQWPARTALRAMLTGGDTLHSYAPREVPFVLVNNYGPTECTVVATSAPVPPQSPAPGLPAIGFPIQNTQVFVLDESQNQVPKGHRGELYIGGAGLARGYRNRPDLTAERFLPNPFSAEPGDRLFKTGDVVRNLPDGQLAFLGCADEQIKIRGFRIEPNEVAAALNVSSVFIWVLTQFTRTIIQDGLNLQLGKNRNRRGESPPVLGRTEANRKPSGYARGLFRWHVSLIGRRACFSP